MRKGSEANANLSRAHRPGATSLREEWRRVLQLSDREMLQLYRQLRDYLALGPGEPAAPDPELEARAASLDAMQRAAEHHGLPTGQAPTVAQYQAAYRALGLPLSSQQVIRRWGYWRTAVMAFEGGRTVPTAEQRALQRASAGRGRSHEDYIAGVRRWLDTDPVSRTDADYDDFVTTYNQKRPADALPLVKVRTLRSTLGFGWAAILAVAYGELDIEDAREQARVRSTAGELVSTIDVARILDINATTMTARSERPGFPVSVATVGPARVWYRADIEAYRDGRPLPDRTPGELQDHLLTTDDVSTAIALASNSVRAAVNRKLWHTVPEPSGKVGQTLYWHRETVDAWLCDHRTLVRQRQSTIRDRR